MFDLISKEYGWTDEVILDLTIGRLRQIEDVIGERHRERELSRLYTREAELRIIAECIAAGSGSAENMSAARSIQLFPRPDEVTSGDRPLPSFESVKGMFGGNA